MLDSPSFYVWHIIATCHFAGVSSSLASLQCLCQQKWVVNQKVTEAMDLALCFLSMHLWSLLVGFCYVPCEMLLALTLFNTLRAFRRQQLYIRRGLLQVQAVKCCCLSKQSGKSSDQNNAWELLVGKEVRKLLLPFWAFWHHDITKPLATAPTTYNVLALICSNRASDAAQKSGVFLCRYRNVGIPRISTETQNNPGPYENWIPASTPWLVEIPSETWGWKSLHYEARLSSCCCFITKIAEHIHHWDTFVLKNGQMLFAATPLAHFQKSEWLYILLMCYWNKIMLHI